MSEATKPMSVVKIDEQWLAEAEAEAKVRSDLYDTMSEASKPVSLKMNEKFLAEAKVGFDEYDANKDGTISMKDLGLAMEADGFKVTQKELEEQYAEFCEMLGDKDGSGSISFDEFASFLFEHSKKMKEMFGSDVVRAFQRIDKNKTGKLTFAEIQKAADEDGYLFNFAGKMTKKRWEENIRKADTDGDGTVDVKEFVSLCFIYV